MFRDGHYDALPLTTVSLAAAFVIITVPVGITFVLLLHSTA